MKCRGLKDIKYDIPVCHECHEGRKGHDGNECHEGHEGYESHEGHEGTWHVLPIQPNTGQFVDEASRGPLGAISSQ